MSAGIKLGFLYPGHSAEDDLPQMAGMLDPNIEVNVVHTSVGEDAHRIDALLDLGQSDRLVPASDPLFGTGIAAVIWACTSGSFVFGRDGAREQVRILEDYLRIPASSTSLAYADALNALGIRRVAIAATYPDDVTQSFVDFLAEYDIETVACRGEGIVTAAEVGRLPVDDIRDMVARGDHPDAEAVVVPDTAAHTATIIEPLEQQLAKPVITANQVSLWQALRLANGLTRRTGLGRLFDTDY